MRDLAGRRKHHFVEMEHSQVRGSGVPMALWACEAVVVLSRSDVRKVAGEEGLAEFADRLVDSVAPGWRLDIGQGAVLGPGATKIGGDPDLAFGEPWPVNHRGIPMTFLAQINTDELPALSEEWVTVAWRPPARVLLRVFADLVDNPVEPGPARVLAAAP